MHILFGYQRDGEPKRVSNLIIIYLKKINIWDHTDIWNDSSTGSIYQNLRFAFAFQNIFEKILLQKFFCWFFLFVFGFTCSGTQEQLSAWCSRIPSRGVWGTMYHLGSNPVLLYPRKYYSLWISFLIHWILF